MGRSTAGTFADLPVEEPYAGVRRRSFDAEGATVTEYVLDAGGRFPLHRHPEEQITVVLEGEVECTVGGERTRLRAGDWAVFAPDVEHGMQAGDDRARFLAVVVPRRASSTAYTVVEGMSEAGEVMVVDAGGGPLLPIVEGEGTARAVIWPGMGSRHRSLHRITLRGGARTVELQHPMEAVYYVLAGSAAVIDPSDGSRQELVEGSIVHVEPDTPYRFEAGADGAEFLGGPCPPDPTLYTDLEG